MERCFCFHRLAKAFCLVVCLSAGICGSTHAEAMARVQPFFTQGAVATSFRPETQSSSPSAPQKAKSGEYVLSRDRYEKAVAYSRASYLMYFVSVGLDVLALVIFLRLGMAAKFRDWAESVSDKRWI